MREITKLWKRLVTNYLLTSMNYLSQSPVALTSKHVGKVLYYILDQQVGLLDSLRNLFQTLACQPLILILNPPFLSSLTLTLTLKSPNTPLFLYFLLQMFNLRHMLFTNFTISLITTQTLFRTPITRNGMTEKRVLYP